MRKTKILPLIATALAIAIVLPTVAFARHSPTAHHHSSRSRHHAARKAPRSSSTTSTSTTGTTTSTGTTSAPSADTVVSYTGGVLQIALTDGTTVTGTVTEHTHIRCAGDEDASSGDGASGSGRDASDGKSRGEDAPGDGSDNQGTGPSSCAPTAGETVLSAELSLTSAGALWREVTLAPSTTTTTTGSTTTSSSSSTASTS